MMTGASKRHVVLGVVLGLAISMGLLCVDHVSVGKSSMRAGPLLSDCDGALRQAVIHYTPEVADVVIPTYRAFLRQLPAEVTVQAVCPDRKAYDDLLARVGATDCRLSPVIVGHPMTTWSRDRWLALGACGAESTLLLCPRREDGAAVWPAREGDERIAGDLAAALGSSVASRRSDLYFDGGDFAADGETVFVRPAVLFRNLQRTVESRQELLDQLAAMLKRRVVLFQDAPDHHLSMYMMPIGNHTVLLGDPRLAERLLAGSPARSAVDDYLPGGPDFSEATAERFDAVAAQCQAAGYRVVRIPVAPGVDGRTYITYLNAILDERDGHHIVYMPTFGPADVLNRAAAEVWTGLGFEVRSVDCTASSRHFGALHCLVNILHRDGA
jgi:N-dimethylarginine dimethylaminohydrolase